MSIKKTWKKLEVTKVKLNPEQAVLSCCDSSGKDMVRAGSQCDHNIGCATVEDGASSAS